MPAIFHDHVHHAVDQGHVGSQVMLHVQVGQVGDLGLPGITTMSLAPLRLTPASAASPAMGCATVVLEPITKTHLASSSSVKELVMAPLPKAAASPATVGACQRRAQ